MAELLSRTRALLGTRALIGPALLLFLAIAYGWIFGPPVQALIETWIVLRLAARAGQDRIRRWIWLVALFALLLVRALVTPLNPVSFGLNPAALIGIALIDAMGGGGGSVLLLAGLIAALGNLLLYLVGRPILAGLFDLTDTAKETRPERGPALALLVLLGLLAVLPPAIPRFVAADDIAIFLLVALLGTLIDILTLAALVAALLPMEEVGAIADRPAAGPGTPPAADEGSAVPSAPAAPAMRLSVWLWRRLRDAWQPALALLLALTLTWLPPGGLLLVIIETWLVLRLFAVCRRPEAQMGFSLLAAAGAVLGRLVLIALLALTGIALALGTALSDQAVMPDSIFNITFLTLIFGGVALGNLAALALLGRLRPWLTGRPAAPAPPLSGWLAVAALGIAGAVVAILGFDLAQRLSNFGQKPGLDGLLPFLMPLFATWLTEVLGWGLIAALLTRDCAEEGRA